MVNAAVFGSLIIFSISVFSGNALELPCGQYKIFVADGGNNRIRWVDPVSGEVGTFVGGEEGFLDGNGQNASLHHPAAITFSPSGSTMFIMDARNQAIRKVSVADGNVTTLAGGQGYTGSDDGYGLSATFNFWIPGRTFAITPDGRWLYVGSSQDCKIRQVDTTNGNVSTIAGNAGCGFADGSTITAQFMTTTATAISSNGEILWIVDTGNNRVRRLHRPSNTVSTFAGSGTAGVSDGVGTAATFAFPVSIVSVGDILYVGQQNNGIPGNGAIRTINTATGQVSTLIMVNVPEGIAVSPSGTTLYVLQAATLSILKINISTGYVSNLAGDSTAGYQDGEGSSARFQPPVFGMTLSIVKQCSTHSGRLPLVPGTGPCELHNLTWQTLVEKEGVSAWTGGLGLLMTDTTQVWACLMHDFLNNSTICPQPPDLACYVYNEVSKIFIFWGANSNLRLVHPST